MIRRFRCLLIVVALCGLAVAVASASAPTAVAATSLHHGLAESQMIHGLHTLRAEMVVWSHTLRWFVPTPQTGVGLAHHLIGIGDLIVKHPFPPPLVVPAMPVGLRGGI